MQFSQEVAKKPVTLFRNLNAIPNMGKEWNIILSKHFFGG